MRQKILNSRTIERIENMDFSHISVSEQMYIDSIVKDIAQKFEYTPNQAIKDDVERPTYIGIVASEVAKEPKPFWYTTEIHDAYVIDSINRCIRRWPDAIFDGYLAEFIDCGNALAEHWNENSVQAYPDYLPSFDEFLLDFENHIRNGKPQE